MTGTIRSRNDALTESPELVNADPYGRGWMFEIEVDPASIPNQMDALMDGAAYQNLVGSNELPDRHSHAASDRSG